MKNFRWSIAVLVFFLTLAVAAGIIIFRERQLQNEPLLNRLKQFEPVETVELQENKGVYLISVRLAYVYDLAAVYRQIDRKIESALGDKNYRLELLDRRDETLIAAYSVVHLALYEGERRGNFIEVSDQIKKMMAGFNLPEHRLTVDGERIYFQARNGEHYLYAVIVRRSGTEEGEPA
jgi:hypothetical protein